MDHLAVVLAEKLFYISLFKHISQSKLAPRIGAHLIKRHFKPIVFLRKRQLFSFLLGFYPAILTLGKMNEFFLLSLTQMVHFSCCEIEIGIRETVTAIHFFPQ